MTPDELASRFPVVFHVADQRASPSIAAHGLLSASALLDVYGVGGGLREEIEGRVRTRSYELRAPGLPLRPLRAGHLDDGLSVGDWCRLLNRRVYLFLRAGNASALLARYPGQRVYRLRTAAVLERHGDGARVTTINAGYAMRRPVRRGHSTFMPVASASGRLQELTVDWAVPDVAGLLLR